MTRWESWSEIIKISGHPLQFQLGNIFFSFILNPFNKLNNSFKPWTYYRKHAKKLVLSKYIRLFLKSLPWGRQSHGDSLWNLPEVTPWVRVEFGLRSWWILSNSFITRGHVLYVSPLALQTGAFLRPLSKLRGSHLLIQEQGQDQGQDLVLWFLLWGANFDHLMSTSGRRGHPTREERRISSCSCSTFRIWSRGYGGTLFTGLLSLTALRITNP